MRYFIAVILALLVCGVSEQAPLAKTRTNETGFSLRDARPVTEKLFFETGESRRFDYEFRYFKSDLDLLFTTSTGCANDRDDYSWQCPALLFERDGKWRVLILEGPLGSGDDFTGKAWQYVGKVTGRDGTDQLFAIIQHTAGDAGPIFYLFHSGDEGETWKLRGAIDFGNKVAVFQSLTMTADGRGTLTVDIYTREAEPWEGLYYYTTLNGGRTWMGPVRVRNQMVNLTQYQTRYVESLGDLKPVPPGVER